MNFDAVIDRSGTHCTQWDYIEDRFGKKDILPFSISDTDFSCPPEILQALEKRMHHGIFGYTRWNHTDFKSAIQHWFQTRFSCHIEQNWIVYSPSVLYSISRLIELLTDEGDHIVVQTPAYDAFFPVIEKNERSLLCNELLLNKGRYTINFSDLEDKLSKEKTKILLLCSPHNPTGRVWTNEELQQIVLLCEKHNVYIISDEIHMDVVHSSHPHTPIVDVAHDVNRVFICTSASKTFNTPGLGGSYIIIADDAVREQYLTLLKQRDGLSSAPIFGISATIAAYNNSANFVDEQNTYIRKNFLIVQNFLRKYLPTVTLTLPESTYLAWIDVSQLPYNMDELQHALVHHGEVAIMRGDTYGAAGKHFIRMNIGCPSSKLLEGLHRLKKGIDALQKTNITEPLFLTPTFQERIWGGSVLKNVFQYDIPSEKTGECWAISAHSNGQTFVKSGTFQGYSLQDLWNHRRHLFGNFDSNQFPLLTKILDANDDLSVQVHPHDAYVHRYENDSYGKNECWYVIDCAEDAELIIGHRATSKKELLSYIENENWEHLLRRIKIKQGDFFYIPAGTIHAICKGALILETQQSSDTTYRLYDYNRIDKDGKQRELHLEKAIDVITVPFAHEKIEAKTEHFLGYSITTYVQSPYFSVYKWDICEKATFIQDQPFLLVSVINGDGVLKSAHMNYQLQKGDHFILPYNLGNFHIHGKVTLIVSHP
ncbi:mannose-6-phosphate isomerase, class I [Bacillus manliponensis]|nr:mannose-6-phosphate isomerase, class I [Bacillus manliponensis]